MNFPYIRAAALAAALAFAGCASDSATSTQPAGPITVSVVGLPDTLAAGDVAVFQVRAQDAAGNDVPEPAATLNSSDPNVAVVYGAGRVRAVAAGVATIRATVAGAVGTARVVIAGGPATFGLRQFGGGSVPLFLEGDSVAFSDGSVELRLLYLDSGTLTLTGGAHPGYETTLHYASYAVTFDDAGQRHLVLRTSHDAKDQGSVRFDARGDLTLTSDLPSLTESVSADTAGFTMLYRFSASDTMPTVALFARKAR